MSRFNYINTLLFSSLLLLNACTGGYTPQKKTESTAEITLNGSPSLVLNSIQSAQLDIRFSIENEDGKTVQLSDFENMHAKKMHLVIFHEDLSHMSHVHPQYIPGENVFRINLNSEIANDFDNQDNPAVFQKPGRYHVVAEVKSTSAGMLMKKFDILVAENDTQLAQLEESNQEDGLHVAYFDSLGNLGSHGAPYKMTFQYHSTPGEGGELISYHTVTEKFNAENNQYESIHNFTPWMRMGAHVIVSSQDGSEIMQKFFAHLHSQRPAPEDGATLTFSYFNRGQMREGLYKYWIQFTHCQEGYVQKLLEIDGVGRMRLCKTPEEGDDESDLSNPRVLVKAPIVINYTETE